MGGAASVVVVASVVLRPLVLSEGNGSSAAAATIPVATLRATKAGGGKLDDVEVASRGGWLGGSAGGFDPSMPMRERRCAAISPDLRRSSS